MTITSTYVDNVCIATSAGGTAAFQLGNAVAAFQGVEALVNGKTYSYSVQQDNNWEFGRGVYNSGARTLTRTVLNSSYGVGAPVNFNVGAQVTFTLLAEDLLEILTNAVPAPLDSYALQFSPWFNSTPDALELLARYTAPTNYIYMPNFGGSAAAPPDVLPSADFAMTVERAPAGAFPLVFTAIGTVVVAAADGTVLMTTAGGEPIAISAGDTIRVRAPSVVDATMAGFSMTIKGFTP